MNGPPSHSATRRALQGLYKIERFYRKKDGARELLLKEKDHLGAGTSFPWRNKGGLLVGCLFLQQMGRACVSDDLIWCLARTVIQVDYVSETG